MLKSKFSFGRVYVYFIFLCFFLALAIFFFSNPNIDNKSGTNNIAGMWIGLLFLTMCVFLFYTITKWAGIIRVYDEMITVNGILKRRKITKEEIRSIDFFAVKNLGSISGNSTTITTVIELTTGERIVLADFLYRNMCEIKQALNEQFKEKIKPFGPINKNRSNAALITTDEVFAGNQFTSINGIFLYGTAAGIVILGIAGKHIDASVFVPFIVIESMFYFGFGYQMYYFIISNDQLIIKNHFWFWYKRTYELDDIIEMNFEQPYRRSKALRITTKDFKTNLYSAGSLRKRNWLALKETAITLDMPYRDYNL
jgi:hypothetical protein